MPFSSTLLRGLCACRARNFKPRCSISRVSRARARDTGWRMSEDLVSAAGEDVPPRILIVDDVDDNRTILRRRFERRGYEIAEADSGKGCLAAIDAGDFDVVLLDVMMP